MSMEREIEHATRLLSQGKALDSAAICGAILAHEPRNAVAAHVLGLALKDSGDWAQGEEWLRFSIELEPRCGDFHANLGNLRRRRGNYPQALEAYAQALQLLPQHRAARRGLALTLHDLRRHPEAELECRTLLAQDARDAEAWLILGMVLAECGRNVEAESAYRRSLAINPDNKIAHHNLGALLVEMERSEAMQALESARRLGADGYEAAYVRGRAALNAGELEEAEASFARAVALQPASLQAQRTLAQLRFMRGDPEFASTLENATRTEPGSVPLALLLAELLWRAGELDAAELTARQLLRREGADAAVQAMLAAILLEAGRAGEAEAHALEAAAGLPDDESVLLNLVSILLARGAADDAVAFIETQLLRRPDAPAWLALEATAARVLGKERYRELYDYERLVRVFDLEAPRGWSSMAELNEALALTLAERHHFTAQPLEQTLRHGTQTSRSLLTDTDPAVRAILQAFAAPIEEYRRQLPTASGHPLTRANNGTSRFTGAWSVRLHRNGYHVNHYHPDGMLSSAYYVQVPAETAESALRAGWLKFGEPRYPVPDVEAAHFVEPRPGRLVLFPSYMWHGTNPIHGNEPRLCIAFDVRPHPT